MAARPVLVVVGDRGRARLFDVEPGEPRLEELEDMVNAGYRLRERELVSDKPGRGMSRAHGSRASLGDDYRQRRHQAELFAKRVAARVQARARQRDYGRIYLVANPEFIGLLRPCLAAQRLKAPLTGIRKDLTRRNAEAIRRHLPKYLR